MQPEDGSAVEDAVSPELAMVDPATASRALEALPEPTLFEDAILRHTHASSSQWDDLWRIGADREGEGEATSRKSRRRLLAIVALVAVVGGAAIAVSAVVERRHRDTPAPAAVTAPPAARPTTAAPPSATTTASAPSTTRATAPATTRAAVPATTRAAVPATTRAAVPATTRATAPTTASAPARTTPAAPARSIPDFVWVAAPGTARYRVEFASTNGRVVLRTETTKTRLHVKPSQLAPGRYVWRVWRLDAKGAPVGRPLVDAKVVVR
jgi:hypothetical protein